MFNRRNAIVGAGAVVVGAAISLPALAVVPPEQRAWATAG